MWRQMRDDDVGHHTNRHRVKERRGTRHTEPGKLGKHTKNHPHRRVTFLRRSSPEEIYYRRATA